jgi:hypothetical protein
VNVARSQEEKRNDPQRIRNTQNIKVVAKVIMSRVEQRGERVGERHRRILKRPGAEYCS